MPSCCLCRPSNAGAEQPPPSTARLRLLLPLVSQVWPDMSDWRLDRRRPAFVLPLGHIPGAEDSGSKRRFFLPLFFPLAGSAGDFLDDKRRKREKRFFFFVLSPSVLPSWLEYPG